jgi:hypothetical protein
MKAELKAELAETKAELRLEIARLSRWMAGMFVTMMLPLPPDPPQVAFAPQPAV